MSDENEDVSPPGVGPEYYYRDQLDSEAEPEEDDIGYHSGATSTRFLSDNEEDRIEDTLEPQLPPSTVEASRKLPSRNPSERSATTPRSSASANNKSNDKINKPLPAPLKQVDSKENLEQLAITEEPQRSDPVKVTSNWETESVEGEPVRITSSVQTEEMNNFLKSSPFRLSVLYDLTKSGKNRLESAVTPQLNKSGLLYGPSYIYCLHIIYEDLLPDEIFNPVKTARRANLVTKSLKVIIFAGKNITVPEGMEVIHRRLRVSLYDPSSANHFASNVHTMLATWNPATPNVWNFPNERGVIALRKDENSFLIRSVFPPGSNLHILLELSALVQRKSDNKEAEVCCGWYTLPVYSNPKERIIAFGQYELKLNLGTVLNPIALESTPLKFSLLGKPKAPVTPSLQIKLAELSGEETEEQSNLPNVIVTSFSTMKLVSLYRDILAETAFVTLDKSVNGRLVHPITDPRVKGFISIVSSADALEIFKGVWHWKCKALKKNQKTRELMKQLFGRTVIEFYPVLHVHDLPSNATQSKERFLLMQRFASSKWEDTLTQNAFHFEPFTIRETVMENYE